MKTSESIKQIAPSLLKAQKSIKAALKDSTNPHFKSKYADLSSVIEAVKSALNDQGITFLQGVGYGEHGVTVETMLLHESAEWISSTLEIPLGKMDAQGVGSATTYGRRYGLQAMCGVPAEDDDGNAATERPKAERGIAQNIDQEIALANVPPEALAEIRREAKGIEGDFYTIGTKAAVERYGAFKTGANAEEIEALWSFLDSKVRNGMKRYKEGVAA